MTYTVRIKKRLSDLRHSDDGSMIPFGVLLGVCMLGFAGFAVDLMRVESRRAQVQGALDSALLAAADVDQKAEPVAVVEDYMAKAGFAAALDGKPVLDTTNGRTVRAAIRDTTTPIFKTYTSPFTVASSSSATNSAPRLEISLVLDISGSMNGAVNVTYDYWGYPISSSTRIAEMQKGAKRFINTLLGDGTKSNVSISIVPFSEQVGIGQTLFSQLPVTGVHPYSHCIDFEDSVFSEAGLFDAADAKQTQHFQLSASSRYTGYNTICPHKAGDQVTLHSRNPTKLGAQIDALRARTGTAIYYGVKWGALLLDPDLRPAIQATKTVDEVFKDRPYDYGTAGVHKIIVVMSDGENSSSTRMNDRYYNTTRKRSRWAKHNFGYWYFYKAGYSAPVSLDDYDENWDPAYYRYNFGTGNTLLENACSAAKARGIEIYSIGVHMTAAGATPLRNCASSQAHYYDVEATEIDEAFTSIAMHSVNLRLTK